MVEILTVAAAFLLPSGDWWLNRNFPLRHEKSKAPRLALPFHVLQIRPDLVVCKSVVMLSSSSSTTASPSSSILSYTSSKSHLSSISLPISYTTTSSSSPSSSSSLSLSLELEGYREPATYRCLLLWYPLFLVLTSPFDCFNFRLAMLHVQYSNVQVLNFRSLYMTSSSS